MEELPPGPRAQGGERGHRLLERVAHIEVPPTLLRDILMSRVDLPSPRRVPSAARPVTGAVVTGVAGHTADVVLAARLRLRALACVLQDIFPGVAAAGDADVVLVHDDLFVAAVREPLIALPDGDIGFDPEGLRRCVAGLADAGKVG